MILYTTSSLVNMMYLGYTLPFEDRAANVREIVFEVSVLSISYLAITLLINSHSIEITEQIGEIIVLVIAITFVPIILIQFVNLLK